MQRILWISKAQSFNAFFQSNTMDLSVATGTGFFKQSENDLGRWYFRPVGYFKNTNFLKSYHLMQ